MNVGDAVLVLSIEVLILGSISSAELVTVLPLGHVGGGSGALTGTLSVEGGTVVDGAIGGLEEERSAIETSSDESGIRDPADIHEGELRSLQGELRVRRGGTLQNRDGGVVRNPGETVSRGSPAQREQTTVTSE